MAVLKPIGIRTNEKTQATVLGSFMESGFGRQNACMWSEMIHNRAFSEITPYSVAMWEWLGLDKDHYCEAAPFWHSGYEENDWETVGSVKLTRTLGSRTYKGHRSLIVVNEENNEGGIKQQGIRLQQGKGYHFAVFACIEGHYASAGLNGFEMTDYSAHRSELTVRIGENIKRFAVGTVSDEYTWDFIAKATETATISITVNDQCVLVLSYVSLMPDDNLDGWRKDVVDCMREAAPTVVRFPGGCFASFYDWQATVGKRNEREPQASYYWGGLEENDVGLDEFLKLSELVGFEPQICFNMMTSNPFKAGMLVEYLNAPQNSGMGRYRALNGHPKPYKVRLFEMDNEPARKWNAKQYAEQCVLFADEMKRVDPDIDLMFAAYAYPIEVLPQMLNIVGHVIKYVIYRQGEPEFCTRAMEIIREYNSKNGTKLKLVNTEWLPPCTSPEPFEIEGVPMDFQWRGEITNDYRTVFSIQQRSWNYALNGAHRILDYISYGGEFALANFNNMCNTFGQNLIEASKETAWLSCMGEVFAFFHRNFKPCTAESVETGDPLLFALKVYEDGAEKMYVINHASDKKQITFAEGSWDCIECLTGESRIGGNTATHSVVSHGKLKKEDDGFNLNGLSVNLFSKKEN